MNKTKLKTNKWINKVSSGVHMEHEEFIAGILLNLRRISSNLSKVRDEKRELKPRGWTWKQLLKGRHIHMYVYTYVATWRPPSLWMWTIWTLLLSKSKMLLRSRISNHVCKLFHYALFVAFRSNSLTKKWVFFLCRY